MFLKNQIIEDFEKIQKLKSITINYINLDRVPLTMVNNDNERDVQKDDSNTIDEPILDNDMPKKYIK